MHHVVLSSGTSVPLTGSLLIGRAPQPHPGEIARALIVEDPSRRISKTHLELRPDDAHVFVIDRSSTNGTIVVRDELVLRCEPGRRVPLQEGDRVHFGPLSLTVNWAPPQAPVVHS